MLPICKLVFPNGSYRNEVCRALWAQCTYTKVVFHLETALISDLYSFIQYFCKGRFHFPSKKKKRKIDVKVTNHKINFNQVFVILKPFILILWEHFALHYSLVDLGATLEKAQRTNCLIISCPTHFQNLTERMLLHI